jgi:hypothetical protein
MSEASTSGTVTNSTVDNLSTDILTNTNVHNSRKSSTWKSLAWNHFKLVFRDTNCENEKEKIAKCNYCQR